MRRGRVAIVTTVSGFQELRLRRAGRVIVLDPEDRVLLFRYDEGPPNGRHWCTPGGGLDDGEDYPAGARRELTEETGWTDVPIGPEVFEHVRIMEYADALVRQHERFYLARVETGRRGLGEVAAMHVSDGIAAWHWWTLAELDATDELVWPTDLADLIRRLMADGEEPPVYAELPALSNLSLASQNEHLIYAVDRGSKVAHDLVTEGGTELPQQHDLKVIGGGTKQRGHGDRFDVSQHCCCPLHLHRFYQLR
jgi:8-oxo-dGTP pyrophosphatase MutT (NUDIX family)